MSENINKKKLTLDDLKQFRLLFESHGYTVVNDFEIPDDELGFDITGNEIMQTPQLENKYSVEDMSDIETYLNGCGYSISRATEIIPETNEEENYSQNMNFCNKYMGEMAFLRTCSSLLALVLSVVITYKVW